MDVDKAIQEYLATLSRLEPLSRVNYAQKLYVFAAWAQEHQIQLEEVRSLTIDNFVDYLRKNHHSNEPDKALSTTTLVGYVRQIKIFLHWCLEDDTYGEV